MDEKKKIDLKEAMTRQGKAAAGLFDKAKTSAALAIDRNGDGKIDLKDVAHIKDQLSEKRRQMTFEADRKSLRPVFNDVLSSPDFSLPKLIRIVEMDKRRAESDACQGSIGYFAEHKGVKILSIFPDQVKTFGLAFYPEPTIDIYYADPFDRDHYIALDQYFHFLRVARVTELQRIAQDLGAKHFRVTYQEETDSAVKDKAKAKGKGKAAGEELQYDAAHESSRKDFARTEIAAEMECIGHAPKQPELQYFKSDSQIKNLIDSRMSSNPLIRQEFTLRLIDSSGIKSNDALKIDAAITALKISDAISVEREVRLESRKYFHYEIEF